MRPRDVGTRAETAVVRWLKVNGFPDAERRALRGQYDAGDVTGIGPLCIQIKAGDAAQDPSDATVRKWLEETDVQRCNAGAALGVLVLRRRGHADPGRWWAWVYGDRLAVILTDDVPLRGDYPVRLLLSDLAASWLAHASAVRRG